MLKGLYTAYTGMLNEQNRMDIMTNNLANASTVGYKKEGTTSQAFDDVLAFKIKDASENGNLSKRMGTISLGVKIGENYTDYSQGSYRTTGNALDVALDGPGFFTVQFTDKNDEMTTKYTRDGSFTIDTDGYLVTSDGDYVMGMNGRIKLNPVLKTQINELGVVSQNGIDVATLRITDFEDYDYLRKYGENYYQPVQGSTEIPGTAKVNSGFLEMSNVQVVREMVDMISITRSYEASQKLIQAYDQTLDISVNQIGKL